MDERDWPLNRDKTFFFLSSAFLQKLRRPPSHAKAAHQGCGRVNYFPFLFGATFKTASFVEANAPITRGLHHPKMYVLFSEGGSASDFKQKRQRR